jgi:hypothetical protein
VAGHGSGVAEAEVGVAVAVDVEEVCALGFADEGRKCAGPFHHPIHGDTSEQRFAGAVEEGFGFRAFVDEFLLLALHEGDEAGAVDGFHEYSRRNGAY